MSSSTFYNRRHRSGFTLTELLIVITIIGLLVGLLTVAGSGAIRTSREFAVNSEIVQLNQAIESFNTKYGFYPPSFEQFKRQSNGSSTAAFVALEANQLLPFLNKIAPNHSELIQSHTAPGFRRIDDWWRRVGVNLNQQTSLQFWLSGVCQNKQFPLTGGFMTDPYLPKAFNIDEFVTGVPIGTGGLEREVFYDFDQQRFVEIGDLAGTANFPVAQYNMNHGKTNGDLFYLYRDAGSYLPFVQPGPIASGNTGAGAQGPNKDAIYSATSSPVTIAGLQSYLALTTHSGAAYYAKEFSPDGSELKLNFGNQNTFQVISAGLDGDAGIGDPDTGNFNNVDRGDIERQFPNADDNLCNFANGRLDKYKLENELK